MCIVWGFGYHPLGMWLDETREPLAMLLRPGDAGSNTATDHRDVLMHSIDQLPAAYRAGHDHSDDPGNGDPSDSGPRRLRRGNESVPRGATRPQHRVFGRFPDRGPDRKLIEQTPGAAWQPAINSDHSERHGAEVVELCGFTRQRRNLPSTHLQRDPTPNPAPDDTKNHPQKQTTPTKPTP